LQEAAVTGSSGYKSGLRPSQDISQTQEARKGGIGKIFID